VAHLGGGSKLKRWFARTFRPVTVATRSLLETVTILFRPWNYAGVMVSSRTYRRIWTDVTSYDGLIEEGIDEQPWWRSRMLKTAAVLSFERARTRRWYGIHEALGICITVALVFGFYVTLLVSSRIARGDLLGSIFISLIVIMAISVVARLRARSSLTASPAYLLAAIAAYALAAGYAEIAAIAFPATLRKLAVVNSVPVATLCICTVILSAGGTVAAITGLAELTTYVRFLRRTASMQFPTILMHVAVELESDTGRRQGLTTERVDLVNLVYLVTSRIELVARNGSKLKDPLVRKELQARLANASLYLQSLALRIVMISHQDERQMIHELRRTAVCLLLQLYDHLPTSTSDNDGNLIAGRRHRKLLYWLRWAVITLLPAGLTTAVQLLQIPVPEIAVQWLTAFAVGWGLVRVISIMEPNYQATIAAARELLGDASRLGGK
jgi:hypothetical protein